MRITIKRMIIKFKCKKMTINKIDINVDDYYEYNDIIL